MSQTYSQEIWTHRAALSLYTPTSNSDRPSSHFRLYWTERALIYSQKGSSCLTKPELNTLGKNITAIPLPAPVCFKQCSTWHSLKETGHDLHAKFCCILNLLFSRISTTTTSIRRLYQTNLSQKFLLPSPANMNLQLEQGKFKMC